MARHDKQEIDRKTRAFYETYSYPGYDAAETPQDLLEKAPHGLYAKLLDEQLPLGVRVLDAGCGTGQFAIFISLSHRKVLGIDFSYNSLRQGREFQKRFHLDNVDFVQMNLFNLGLKEETFDYVFSNGVLHHTGDAYGAFRNLCALVKPGGYITVGLYNPYGSLLLDVRKVIFRLTHDRLKWLDYFERQKTLGEDRKRIWFIGNYKSPFDDKISVDQVLRWFRENGILYVNSIPKIRFGETLSEKERLFEPHEPGGVISHFLCQLGWIFSQGKEHGFFITIGRKLPRSA